MRLPSTVTFQAAIGLALAMATSLSAAPSPNDKPSAPTDSGQPKIIFAPVPPKDTTPQVKPREPQRALAGCDENLCFADRLSPFYALLDGQLRGENRAVRILQIGDSHTAGDMITGALRTSLQTKYGSNGRGVMAAGKPWDGFVSDGIKPSQSAGWRVSGSFGKAYSNSEGALLGLTSYTQGTSKAGETLGITSVDPAQDFDAIRLCALTQPDGGSVQVQIGDTIETWSLDTENFTVTCHEFASNRRVNSALVTTLDDKRVAITSFASRRGDRGVSLSNLGVAGSQLRHLARLSDGVLQAEFAAYRPDMIILAFGTNEAFDAKPDAGDYRSVLKTQVARLRRLVGRNIPFLLIGPPDAQTKLGSIAYNAGTPEYCPDSRYTPAYLAKVRTIQHAFARDNGLAYWDWQRAMGGPCSAHDWYLRGEMLGDHVHFKRPGATGIARLLFSDLERGKAMRKKSGGY